MEKITMKDLERAVSEINRLTGNPTEQANHYIPNQYILSGAYGGHKLEQVCKNGHGVNSITSGYVSKRELYNQLQAMIIGLRMRG